MDGVCKAVSRLSFMNSQGFTSLWHSLVYAQRSLRRRFCGNKANGRSDSWCAHLLAGDGALEGS